MLAFLLLGIFNISLTNAFMSDYLKCEKGWLQFDGCCYLFGDTEETHETSRAICQSKSANLAEPVDRMLNAFIQLKTSKHDRHWIGINAIADKDEVRLEDSQKKLDQFEDDFRNWHRSTNLHRHPGTNCVVMDEDGKWVFADCDNVERYVCEKRDCLRESLLSLNNEQLEEIEKGEDDDKDDRRGGKLIRPFIPRPRIPKKPFVRLPSTKKPNNNKKKPGNKNDKKKPGNKNNKKKPGNKNNKKKP